MGADLKEVFVRIIMFGNGTGPLIVFGLGGINRD
jgi:hypothetical protein